jgi:hypothetical protein
MHFDPRDKRLLTEGMVITIEPHITTGKGRIYQAKDGWGPCSRATKARWRNLSIPS